MSALGTRATTGADLREGGAWSRAQRWKNDLLYAAVRALLLVLAPWPEAWLRAAGRWLGVLSHAVLGSARRIARANVARVFPGAPACERRALVRRAYRVLGEHLGETVALLERPARFRPLAIDPSGRQVLEDARAEGRGVVFASAHLGPWERVAGSLVAGGFPLTTLAREAYDPRLTRLYDRLRGPLGVAVIYRGTPGAAARIVRALREGGLLGVPMDLRGRVASVTVPFLGHAAATAVGPARIALRTGAPVVVGTVAPSGTGAGDLQLTCTRIGSEDLPATEAGEVELTARINAELSRRILALPHAWVWMHARW